MMKCEPSSISLRIESLFPLVRCELSISLKVLSLYHLVRCGPSLISLVETIAPRSVRAALTPSSRAVTVVTSYAAVNAVSSPPYLSVRMCESE